MNTSQAAVTRHIVCRPASDYSRYSEKNGECVNKRKVKNVRLIPSSRSLNWKIILCDSHPSMVDSAAWLHWGGKRGWRRITHHRQGRSDWRVAAVDVRVRLESYLLDGRRCCSGRWHDVIFLDIFVVRDFFNSRFDARGRRNRFLKTHKFIVKTVFNLRLSAHFFLADDGFV